VPGGGVALLRCLKALDKFSAGNADEQVGVDIVKRALEEPLRQIATNAGVEGSVIVEKVKAESKSVGYNAADDKIEDLVKAGVIDPTKVVRTAIENAASISGLMLTTEAMIADKPEENKGGPMMPPGGGGMGGMY
jgi:chaperonin GroEL